MFLCTEKQQSEPNLLTYSRWAMRLDAESEKRIQVRPELVLISDGYFDIKVLNDILQPLIWMGRTTRSNVD
ncbi:unnamed protein product [Urochloa humidicola]